MRTDAPSQPATAPEEARAWFAGIRAGRAVDCVEPARDGWGALDRGGFWVVVGEFEGPLRAWRFADVERSGSTGGSPSVPDRPLLDDPPPEAWSGPPADAWTSSLDAAGFTAGVQRIRAAVREGEVYQVNLCRVLSAPLPAAGGRAPSAAGLAARLRAGNPAPFAGGIHVPRSTGLPPVWVVSASPELFLRVQDGVVTSGPIKGTATTAEGLTAKDRAENVMIADMVRNDLQQVSDPGTVEVTALLQVEHHPGLVHLVTTVAGRLRAGVGWGDLLGATFPPASVSGAPRSSALRLIAAVEPVPRGPYCGTVGWVDADAGRAELAVGIRTFWWTDDADGGVLRFGTGAGITWGSDPGGEWDETVLKARTLVGLASAVPSVPTGA